MQQVLMEAYRVGSQYGGVGVPLGSRESLFELDQPTTPRYSKLSTRLSFRRLA
jgi:hypothetical protein